MEKGFKISSNDKKYTRGQKRQGTRKTKVRSVGLEKHPANKIIWKNGRGKE